MKVVKVYGALRKRLGQCRFEFDVATPAQAIKALCVNFPGLDKWLIDSEKDGVGYRVAVSREKATEENVAPLLMPFSDREVFSITPVVAGAGRGTGTILAGIALISVAVLSSGAGLFANGAIGFGTTATTATGAAAVPTLGASLAAAAGNIGIGLVLAGIAQSISPQPGLNSTLDESVQLESFTFSNVVNTSRQGMPCPIAYGRLFVGSAVLSSGLDVDQVQV
nr:putative phage-related protein tail component [uncultured Mediterranean phage uvMED]BAR23582.1 putative phage-related protein tail component [uncultured Mediterranean phage uvMED]BAR23638.1 putative phage-related protein tail component [uncultured Mediterranean phage uvMED]BAR23657.1 putative phage-related protein tail component [uncultured Mediterranean phage uvMED]BAR39166.1 putative phage-related protein tail component [uncultured Mediterranean phage uvMED]